MSFPNQCFWLFHLVIDQKPKSNQNDAQKANTLDIGPHGNPFVMSISLASFSFFGDGI